MATKLPKSVKISCSKHSVKQDRPSFRSCGASEFPFHLIISKSEGFPGGSRAKALASSLSVHVMGCRSCPHLCLLGVGQDRFMDAVPTAGLCERSPPWMTHRPLEHFQSSAVSSLGRATRAKGLEADHIHRHLHRQESLPGGRALTPKCSSAKRCECRMTETFSHAR